MIGLLLPEWTLSSAADLAPADVGAKLYGYSRRLPGSQASRCSGVVEVVGELARMGAGDRRGIHDDVRITRSAEIRQLHDILARTLSDQDSAKRQRIAGDAPS